MSVPEASSERLVIHGVLELSTLKATSIEKFGELESNITDYDTYSTVQVAFAVIYKAAFAALDMPLRTIWTEQRVDRPLLFHQGVIDKVVERTGSWSRSSMKSDLTKRLKPELDQELDATNKAHVTQVEEVQAELLKCMQHERDEILKHHASELVKEQTNARPALSTSSGHGSRLPLSARAPAAVTPKPSLSQPVEPAPVVPLTAEPADAPYADAVTA